jgi:hypothetical protein
MLGARLAILPPSSGNRRSSGLAGVFRQPKVVVLISLLQFRHVANPVYVPSLPRGMLAAAVSLASS